MRAKEQQQREQVTKEVGQSVKIRSRSKGSSGGMVRGLAPKRGEVIFRGTREVRADARVGVQDSLISMVKEYLKNTLLSHLSTKKVSPLS